MILDLKKKNVFFDLSTFRVFYLLSLLFELVAIPSIELVAGYINGLTFIWGILISLHTMFHEPQKFKIEYKNIAFFFIFLCFFTSIFNFSSNILMNLIVSFNNFMCIFLFFGMSKNTSIKKIESEFNFILKFIILFSIIISSISLYILFKFVHIKLSNNNLGIFKNRFFGISTNPNQLGFLSVISIFSCDLITDKYMLNKFKINKMFVKFCIALNIVTLFLTDSNASFVFITVYIIIRIFYENFSKYDKLKDIKFLREIIFILMCITVVISGSFLMRMGCQKLINKIISFQNVKKQLVIQNNNEIENKLEENLKLDRADHELSSGRLILYKQGIKLSKINPLIGIGRENLSYYGKIYIKGGLAFPCKHPDLHNLYLTLIVSYGWLGFLTFSTFITLVIHKIAHEVFIRTRSTDSKIISKLFAIIISYFSYANFEVGVMSGISLSDVLIWIYLGYTMTLINNINERS